MTDFKTSETAKNLMRAFAGESQARNRYTFAAGLAKEQKMPMVEAVFSYTADQEKEHAEIFYDYLKPLDKETIFIDGGYPVDLEKNTLALKRDTPGMAKEKSSSPWDWTLSMSRFFARPYISVIILSISSGMIRLSP